MKLQEINDMGFDIEQVDSKVTIYSKIDLYSEDDITKINCASSEVVDECYDKCETFYNVYDKKNEKVLELVELDDVIEFFNTGFKEKYYQKYAEMALGKNVTIGYIKFLKYCIEHPAENALDDLAREEFKCNWDHEFMNIARRQ